MNERSSQRRILELDVLRCLAILLVLGSHRAIQFESKESEPFVSHAWMMVGWTGVDLFFVLSGFLVGGLIFVEINQTGRLDIPRFLLRRGLRIWPAYYFFLLVVSLMFVVGGTSLAGLVPSYFQVQNYFEQQRYAAHTWSLAVEEHFYLLLPIVLSAGLAKATPRTFAVVSLAIFGAAAMGRWFSTPGIPEIRTHLRVDSLWAGVWCAYLYYRQSPFFDRIMGAWRWLLILSASMVCLAMLLPWRTMGASLNLLGTLFPLVLSIAYACMLTGALGLAKDGGVRFAPLARLTKLAARMGVYSYSIYLWHIIGARDTVKVLLDETILYALPPLVRWGIGMAAYIALAYLVGEVTYRCIERPMLRVRDKFVPRVPSSPTEVTLPPVEIQVASPRRSRALPVLVELGRE
ncbi:O-acetyltransferase OatA [Planctomycetes bacterium Pan216]|uniref:O-acetyltransferase OatA n=1 Tax=Kolteria novifilia TaxID=2527975 RepID=A0A518B5S5_9BACT|nr:O-acetyltransferase OatA [Planctomycetes bacterium Pan216]